MKHVLHLLVAAAWLPACQGPSSTETTTATDEARSPIQLDQMAGREPADFLIQSDGNDSVNCSMTLRQAGTDLVQSTDLPGDRLVFKNADGDFLKPVTPYCTGDGSEIRFDGNLTLPPDVDVSVSDRLLLRFRKDAGTWYFISGSGVVKKGGDVTRYGFERTHDSSLVLLQSPDPLLREGGAWDAVRTAGKDDIPRVVRALAGALMDDSEFVRRAAAIGLGEICNEEAKTALWRATDSERETVTRDFLAKAVEACMTWDDHLNHCKSSPNCSLDDPKCRGSSECKEWGRCGVRNGVCVAVANHDCKSSKACSRQGRCEAVGYECAAVSKQDCEASELCRQYGRCVAVDGECASGG